MHFATILEHNRRFAQGRARTPLPAPASVPVVVVACYDPRLDPLLRPALGLEEHEALILRAPGAGVGPDSSTMRHLCVAVHMFGVEEVLVVGHSSCRMAAFDTSAFIDAFRRRGIPREVFGPEDIRAWAGAIPDPRHGVLASIGAITASPFLPRGLPVGGLVLDDEAGSVEVVLKPGEALPAGAVVSAGAGIPAGAAISPGAAGTSGQATTPGQATTRSEPAAAPSQAPPRSTASPAPPRVHEDPAMDAARAIVRTLASARDWREDLQRLRSDMGKQRNPFLALALLESFIGRAASQSHEVADAFKRLKREAAGGASRAGTAGAAGRAGAGAVLELVRQAIEEAEER